MKKFFFPLLLPLLLNLPLAAQDETWRDTVDNLQRAFRQVSRQVLPVVVEIDVVDIVIRESPSFNPWQFFFGNPGENNPFPDPGESEPREYRQSGLGSGIIVDQRGRTVYVITNYHVAGEADEIRITLYDGREYEANLAGTDRERDLALLSFRSDEEIPAARLGDSDAVEVGDWVLAVGNPYGLESTVTKGIISAGHRRGVGATGGNSDYLQTDAAINSGNSGGALVNLEGEVIGINTWIASQTGGNRGLGFAIPINQVKESLEDLISLGRVDHPWLGVNINTAIPSLKSQMGLEEWAGVFVFNVYRNSPADEGEILPGDLIIALDGRPVGTAEDLMALVDGKSTGDRVKITLVRGGRELTKTIRLASKSESPPWPGFTLAELTQELRDRMGLSRNEGSLIIGDVQERSQAASLGMRNGDILKSINGKYPRSLTEFYGALGDSRDVRITIVRRGFEFTYRLQIE